MELLLIDKTAANEVLSPRGNLSGSGIGKHQPQPTNFPKKTAHASMYFSVKDNCIINDCALEVLFKQNFYHVDKSYFSESRAELKAANLLELTHWKSEEPFNNCFLGYNGGYSLGLDTKRKPACYQRDFCSYPLHPAEDALKQEIFAEFDNLKNYYWPGLTSRENSYEARAALVGRLRQHVNEDLCPIEVSRLTLNELVRGRGLGLDVFKKVFPRVAGRPEARNSTCPLDLPTSMDIVEYENMLGTGLFLVGLFLVFGFFFVIYRKHESDAWQRDMEQRRGSMI